MAPPKLDDDKLNMVKHWRSGPPVRWEECVRRLDLMGIKITVGALIKRCRRFGSILVNGRVSYELWCAPDPQKVRRAKIAWKRKFKITKTVNRSSVPSGGLSAITAVSAAIPPLPVVVVKDELAQVVLVAAGAGKVDETSQVPKVADVEIVSQPVPVGGGKEKVDKLPIEGPSSSPSVPVAICGSGVIRSGKSREEQDEILRRLQARSAAATRKLEAEAARPTFEQIQEKNEAEMVPIRQAIALDKINATALKPGSVVRGDTKPEKPTETAP